MTRSRRDGDHDNDEDDDGKPISDKEIAEHAPTPTDSEPTTRDVLAIEALRWVYSPGVTVLQYFAAGAWVTVPSVTLAEAEAESIGTA
jgi:hypothetical protein